MIWAPRVTVAAVIERDHRFLMVEELHEGRKVYNQPAGHLESGESLIDAAIRETREETGWRFRPTAIIGIYRWVHSEKDVTYLRICFTGVGEGHDPGQPLDEGILQAPWLTRDELQRASQHLRSPLVLHCIDDYLAGRRYPLELYHDIAAAE